MRSGSGGASLPGIIFNLNKQITYTPASAPGAPPGTPRTVHAGRMECTMQVPPRSMPLLHTRTASSRIHSGRTVQCCVTVQDSVSPAG